MPTPDDKQRLQCARLLGIQSTALLLLDNDLQLLYLNPAAENLFQVSSRQITGQPWSSVVLVSETMQKHLLDALDQQISFIERELELTAVNGQQMVVDFTVTTTSHSELLLEIVRRDQFIRIAHEEQLLVQQRAARELLRGMAHEIKNPLGGLRGAAQLLESELGDEEMKEYTQVIMREADRLRNLVDRMLGPNDLPHKQMINIHQVLEHVHSLVEAEGNEAIQLVREYDPSIPDLCADSEQLIQAVLNLVRNAMQSGADRIVLSSRAQRQVTIGQKRYRLAVRIDISDNGKGIDENMKEQIFYPMITGRAEGTGLGLSIAQSMVNRHNGIIEFTSEPGSTMFTILLPLEEA
ncbi:two-component system nitrogen regulation sensor histidine kinase GlnL [Thiogranum longum]|uniref:Sensory histidine kinase/phosphatase NtrB n=1 Tax=Thiogranum longum TaxID=1537524 RepID=A0A4R1H8P4_9GAMM|nr:nitrogen regulation protein NR(II) [Thiogranum longum]TCK16881.1 two-component system nitrogen regulation sensor histidine kinase GlnL [Thiogranum longum]